MKNIHVIFIGFLALVIGFGIAWFIKPEENQANPTSNNQKIEGSENQTWTCSMHPQIRQSEPGLCPICEMDLIPLEANTSNDPLVLEMTKEAVKLANIQTTVIGQETTGSSKKIQLSGKIQADERLAASLVTHVPGRIEQLFVSFTGEQVNKGQKLASLYSPDLITAQRELLEALKLKEVNPNLVEAAKNKLRYWKIGDDVINKIEQEGKIQETFTLFAASSGIVTQRRVALGDYVKQGEALFDMMDLSRVWVIFDAYEDDLPHISLGNQLTFSTPAIPNKTFSTRISFIDPVINAQTRVAAIRGAISNPGQRLKPEMFVQGTIEGTTVTSAQLSVPKSAVLWTGTRSVVYVKMPNMAVPSFQFREVELGEAQGDHYQVVSGLEAGEEVVTYGSFTIDAAAQLNNQASMMNKKVLVEGEAPSTLLPDFKADTPTEFKMQLGKLTDAYLILKDALVETDAGKAAKAAHGFSQALDQTNKALLKEAAQEYWMEQLEVLRIHGNKIRETSDVEEQRQQFDFVSQALIKSLKVFGTPDDTYYIQHCPMAFNDTGADWISDAEEILNPYFGDVMLRCGLVQETITKGLGK